MSITVQIRNLITGDLSPHRISADHAKELQLQEGNEITIQQTLQLCGIRVRDGFKQLRQQTHQAKL